MTPQAAAQTFYRSDPGGLTVSLKVTPKSSRETIDGAVRTPDGWALKVAVTAPPDKGKANAAVIAVMARAFGIAKSRVTLTVGETDRRKVVRIEGDPAQLATIAQQWVTT